jgi:hypothetical protein
MINNLSLIAPLLNFTEPGDFYMLYVFKRKKDQPEGEKENNQSVRTIKTYCIESLEQLNERYAEIQQLCEMFKARAYIHVNKLNHSDISLIMLERLAKRIRENVIRQKHLFDSVVGELKSTEKRWIVDLDSLDDDYIAEVETAVNNCEPEGNKIIARIPTRNGLHLITSRFNTLQFKQHYGDVDIQKHNPTLLYLPDSLN